MAKQEQTTGDNSTSQQAGRDIINVGLTYADVHRITHEIMKGELAVAIRDAQDEMARRLEFFAEKLIPALVEKNISAERFSKPEVQLFVHDTQRRFLESGSEQPSEMTIDLVTKTLGETPGSPRELIFKEAAKISSSINSQTANFISLIFLLTRTKKTGTLQIPRGADTSYLRSALAKFVAAIEIDLQKLFPLPKISQTERDYLVMIGVLQRQPLSKYKPDQYLYQHTDVVHSPLTKTEVQKLLSAGADDADFVWLGPDKTYAVAANTSSQTFSVFSSNVSSQPSSSSPPSWQSHSVWQAKKDQPGGPVVEPILAELTANSSVFQNLRELHSNNVIGAELLTPIGVAIGLSNLRRLGLTLDDKIWFPD